MKNSRQELLARLQRRYHQQHTWRLEGGLYLPHSYENKRDLAWWDDVGFIHGGRRVIVWFQHPRMLYADEIERLAWHEAGPAPGNGCTLLDGSTKNYKKVGASRKKIVSYTCSRPSIEWEQYYASLDLIQKRMTANGIDFKVEPSFEIQRLSWATGVNLVVPMNASNEGDMRLIADLVRRLMKGQTTLAAEFPWYQYKKEDWLREQPA